MPPDLPFDAVTFDCFGTLVDVDPPPDVAAAIADALAVLATELEGGAWA
jgi:FMN phosphatase YigB (HAD superfamily)